MHSDAVIDELDFFHIFLQMQQADDIVRIFLSRQIDRDDRAAAAVLPGCGNLLIADIAVGFFDQLIDCGQ